MSDASERVERWARVMKAVADDSNEVDFREATEVRISFKDVLAMLDERRALIEACEAAKAYDVAIRKSLHEGQFERLEDGSGIATGDDLDALYDAWISKVNAAVP